MVPESVCDNNGNVILKLESRYFSALFNGLEDARDCQGESKRRVTDLYGVMYSQF
jgi:hypothetical protein